MLARVCTFAIDGFDTRRVSVEVDLRAGLPAFAIVGLGDAAVREARERVRPAIENSGFKFPQQRITANLAPADLRKVGPGFDLALALGVLAASGQIPVEALERHAVFAELSLGGELRACRGTLAVAQGARSAGLEGVILAPDRAREAALVEGLDVIAAPTLRDVAAALGGERLPDPPPPDDPPAAGGSSPDGDIADVRGHEGPIRALTLAAAGGHNLLLCGPPGTGKTMLARRLPSILPPLTRPEAIEITRIHSVAGLHDGRGLVHARPFRAPHHTISPAGLVGGGVPPVPGEATLAHHGVLFLDELSEFSRSTLEALRQPLEDGRVAIVRGQQTAVFPTRFMLVAATNPCPCGFAGVADRCRCGEADLARHRRRLSGPLLDRLDMLVHVERPAAECLRGTPGPSSEALRAVVSEARARQRARLDARPTECNAQLTGRALRDVVRLDPGAEEVLHRAYREGALSARGHERVLRVARTIADVEARERVSRGDVLTALALRQEGLVEEQGAA